MIKNLPDHIDPSIVQNFSMGSVEAPEDVLLWDCFCPISPVTRFLDGTKDIVLGAKGVGKSAIFTLLIRGQLEFANPSDLRQFLLPIDQQIEYSKLKALSLKYLKSDIEDEDTRYRFLWEMYILYRICVRLKSEKLIDRTELRQSVDSYIEIFSGKSTKPTFLELLTSTRKTVGVKLDASNPALPTPDVYFTVEPAGGQMDAESDIAHLDITGLRKGINQCLRRNKAVFYVLIDNVDDFVAREEYQVQKVLLQGLLQTTRDYSSYAHLKIKLFLRTELYNKLNFSQLGGKDKISHRTVVLKWDDSNIRQFLAERFLYILSRQLHIRKFEVESEGRSLLLDRKDKSNASLLRKVMKWTQKRFGLLPPKDERDARSVDFMDDLYSTVITTILPRTVAHFDSRGGEAEMSVFDYLDSHFCQADGETTPRVALLFFERVFSICGQYYARNPDENPMKRDFNREYPLVKREHLRQAYSELQGEMIEIFKSAITHREWARMLDILFSRKGKKQSFSFGHIKKLVGQPDDEPMREFVAYLCHLGVLHCRDKSVQLQQRIYELPVILQHNWQPAK